MLDRQDVFDKALGHMRKQGAQAMEGGICVYLSESGSKCAVGCLVDRQHYTKDMEEENADNENVLLALSLSGYEVTEDEGDGTFLKRLQVDLHDGYSRKVYEGLLPPTESPKERGTPFIDWLNKSAEEFAKTFKLTYANP